MNADEQIQDLYDEEGPDTPICFSYLMEINIELETFKCFIFFPIFLDFLMNSCTIDLHRPICIVLE